MLAVALGKSPDVRGVCHLGERGSMLGIVVTRSELTIYAANSACSMACTVLAGVPFISTLALQPVVRPHVAAAEVLPGLCAHR
eukprot:scaffold96431_cov18-Tisochrysis_lutea.AAC.1